MAYIEFHDGVNRACLAEHMGLCEAVSHEMFTFRDIYERENDPALVEVKPLSDVWF